METNRSREAEVGWSLSLTPRGHLVVEAATGPGGLVGPAAPAILEAFRRGEGNGLFHLGAGETRTELPPSWSFFRDVALLWVTRRCLTPEAGGGGEEVAAPTIELAALVSAVPPMPGAEYLTQETLLGLWTTIGRAFDDEFRASGATLQEFLHERNPVWNVVGRVHFHLAERKDDERMPFAFLATYTSGAGRAGRPVHRALGSAVNASATARDHAALLSLLAPVHRAAEASPLVRSLVDSGEIFRPLAWRPAQAFAFLQELPAIEGAGVVVKVPDWWQRRRASGPTVQISIGAKEPAGVGADAILDFDVAVGIDGERLDAAALRELLANDDGFVRFRGKWVALDRERLEGVLAHWRRVEAAVARDGLSFAQGMRLLAGLPAGIGRAADGTGEYPEWSRVFAGPWFAATLARLRGEHGGDAWKPPAALRATLRPYQITGAAWLSFVTGLGLGACLADDMGLGKTLQVLALLLARRADGVRKPTLLVVPASLVGNWQAEIARFSPSLRVYVAHTSERPVAELVADGEAAARDHDLVITTYGMVARVPWIGTTPFGLVVLDEAQAIKNAGTRQARAVKAVVSEVRIALTGTPIENDLGDLWSLFDFLNPGLLGSADSFSRLVKALQNATPPDLGRLRTLVRPYILRRLKTDRRVIADLPEKTEVTAYCALTKRQAALYQEAVEDLRERLGGQTGMERRGLVLACLLRLKQICNHPAQWTGQGDFERAESGKFLRLAEIVAEIAARREKVLVFTQFRELADPLARALAELFGRPGFVLHGGTAVSKRRELVDRFQEDESIPFFVLSLKAGGVGLNLTAATHVVHFDRWWNPAVENQATDRAFRIGQKRNVVVHKFVCTGTVEERIDAMLESKRRIADEVLGAGAETLVTEMSDAELLDFVRMDARRALAEL